MDEMARAIRNFCERVAEIERVVGVLDEVFGMQPECALHSAVYALAGGYQATLDSTYGLAGWLEWWWLECGLGSRPLQASPAGGKLRLITTVDDLVQLILEHRAAAPDA